MVRGLIGLGLAIFAAFFFVMDPVHAQSGQKTTYELPFGTNPYAPSRARAAFRDFLNPSEIPPAQY
jgi:hypothetical protein